MFCGFILERQALLFIDDGSPTLRLGASKGVSVPDVYLTYIAAQGLLRGRELS